ncbi:MAG: APC family permease [Thermoplasmata archaeon]
MHSSKVKSQRRKLGLEELVAIGIGGMIGSGIYSLLGVAVHISGGYAFFAFLLAGAIALLSGYSFAKLGRADKTDEGAFSYLLRASGSRAFASFNVWMMVLGYIGTVALYAYTFGAYSASFFEGYVGYAVMRSVMAIVVIAIFVIVNLMRVESFGMFQLIIVSAGIGILLIFCVVGAIHVGVGTPVTIESSDPLLIPISAGIVFVGFQGFELVTASVRDARSPERNISRAIYLSIIITTLLYLIGTMAATSVLSTSQIIRFDERALEEAARPILGQFGFFLVGIGALFAAAGAINATIFGTARFAKEASKEGVMPSVFCRTETSRGTPYAGILIIGFFSAVLALTGNLEVITAFASIIFLLLYGFVSLANLKLRLETGSSAWIPLAGSMLCFFSLASVLVYLGLRDPQILLTIGTMFLALLALWLAYQRYARASEERRVP